MESKKQKIIKVLKRIGVGLSIGFNILFLMAIIIGSTANKKQVNCSLAESDNVVEKLDIKQDIKRFASYDSSTYTYTFDVDEVNTISFYNFALFIGEYNNLSHLSLVYNGNNFANSSSVGSSYYYWWYPSGSPSVSNNFLVLDLTDNYTFKYSQSIPSSVPSANIFTSLQYGFSLHLNTSSTDEIESFVNAVNLDINFVESSINDGIFETLTSGVVAFVDSIGSGIVAMTTVFYDSSNSQLTTIGLLSVIVVAVSLAYFLFRLLIGLIRMRG